MKPAGSRLKNCPKIGQVISSRAKGSAAGGVKSAGRERLENYPFYAAALAEMEMARGQRARARDRFREALALARNPTERRFLERRLAACDATAAG